MLPKRFLSAQAGYIGLSVVIFLLFTAVFLPPKITPPKKENPCVVGVPPKQEKILQLPPIKNFATFPGNGLKFGMDKDSPDVGYKLIRENVPILKYPTFETDDDPDSVSVQEHYLLADPKYLGKYELWYPGQYGEIDFPRSFTPKYPYDILKTSDNSIYQIRFRMEGMIFLLHLDDKGSEIIKMVSQTDETGQTHLKKAVIADVYQWDDIADDPARDYTYDEIFRCHTTLTQDQSLADPAQNKSTGKDQLQLEWFLFSESGAWEAHCKPAIYLYPPKKQLVNVRIHPLGFLTYTDPPYDFDKGWTVWAEPDGKLNAFSSQSSALSYDYLYFESKIRDEVIKKPTKGWVIKSEESGVKSEEWFNPLQNHFNQILPKLGLNEKQTNDFIEYWNRALPKAPYYFVGVIDQENVNRIERLEITPKPDSINRVRVYFERLDSPKVVEEPSVISHKQSLRSDDLQSSAEDRQLRADSFRVVEWGGMVKNDPDHPFTCSQ